MQENRWQKIEEIFNQAVLLPVEKRQDFVENKCGTDTKLCHEILLLINNDKAENSFLNRPVFTVAAKILDSDFSQLLANGQFAMYKIHKLLGQGGMGLVFLAEDTRLERLIALKVLPNSLTQSNESILRFQQEARAASNVSHQNVAHIYEFGKYEDSYYLAMEYVRGSTLRELIKNKLISQQRAIDFVIQVAAALQAAYRAGIIHRDIKPENIIVSEDNLIKVLDFGLAKQRSSGQRSDRSSSASTIETTPGLIMGTIAYMSPEQIRGQSLDHRSDLWSLGVVFYELLTGVRPFKGETQSDVQASILRDAYSPLPKSIQHADEIDLILKKCLHKNRNERFETASEFMQELQQIKEKADKYLADGNNSTITRRWRDLLFKVFLPLALTGGLTLTATTLIPSLRIFLVPDKEQLKYGIEQYQGEQNIRSLVVLPFRIIAEGDKNRDEIQSLEFFSLGLAEDLSRSLGSGNSIRVKAFSAAQKMREVDDEREIKERLNVDALLRGKIKHENEQLVVSIELVHLNDSTILWKDSFKATPNALVKLRNTLEAIIANNLQAQLKTDDQLVLPDYQTRNEAAFRAYLEGKYSPSRHTAEGTRQAIDALKRAVEIDPNYSLAHSALADAYNLYGSWFGVSPEENLTQANQALDKALQTGELLSEVHTTRAKIKMDYDRDFAASEIEFKKAIELNPNNALAHHWYGEVFLSAMGRFEESIRELEIARELNPLSANILTGLAWSRLGIKDYEGAIIECDRAIRLDPNESSAYSYKAMAQMKLGRWDEAIENALRSAEISKEKVDLGVIYGLRGQTEKAQKILREMQKEAHSGKHTSAYDLAVIYAAIGDRNRAFSLLEKEVKSKSVDLLSIRVDPLLDPLRDDPRFTALEAKLNLP